MLRNKINTPEWAEFKKELELQRNVALQSLVKTGLTEGEYHQWRGRVHLCNALLGHESAPSSVTD